MRALRRLALAATVALLGLAPATSALAATSSKGPAATPRSTQLRLGGTRGFGRGPGIGFGRSRSRYGYGRRVSPFGVRRHGVFRNVLRAIGIAYVVHALFGWGAGGGSPFGLLVILAIVLWIATRRRRRPAFPY